MNRQTVRVIGCIVLLIGLLVVPVTLAEDDGYTEVADAIEHLLDRLEHILYRTAWWGTAGGEANRYLKAQELLNLIEGPLGAHYDTEASVHLNVPDSREAFPLGVETPEDALFPGFEALVRLRPTQYLHGESVIEFLNMQRNVERNLGLAHQDVLVALEAIDDEETFEWHMDHAVAVLVMARGSVNDRFIPQGLLAMTELLPSRRYWVEEGDSIQAAIDRAPEDGTVLVGPGVFNEPLTIRKSIHLVGSAELGGTLIEGGWQAARANAIECSSTGEPIAVSITGITLRGTKDVSGVYDWATGVYAWGAVELTLANVAIESFANAGLVVSDTSQVHGSSLAFSGNGSAIVLTDDALCQLNGIWIGRSLSEQAAVLLAGAARLSLSVATIADSEGDGILYEPTASIELNEVQLLRNGGYGVRMKDAVCETSPDAPETDYFTIQETYHASGEGNSSPDPDEENGNVLGGFCPEILEFLKLVLPH